MTSSRVRVTVRSQRAVSMVENGERARTSWWRSLGFQSQVPLDCRDLVPAAGPSQGQGGRDTVAVRECRHPQVRGEFGGVQRTGQPARPTRINLPDVHAVATQQPDLLGLVDGVLPGRQRDRRPGRPQPAPAERAGRQQLLGEGDLKIRQDRQQPYCLVKAASTQAVDHEPPLPRSLPQRGESLRNCPRPGEDQWLGQWPLLTPETRLCDPGRRFRSRRVGRVEPECGGVGRNGVADRAAQQVGHAHPRGAGGHVPAGQFDCGGGLPGVRATVVAPGLLPGRASRKRRHRPARWRT